MFALPNSYFTEKVVGSTFTSCQLPCLVPSLGLGEHETASDQGVFECWGTARWEDWEDCFCLCLSHLSLRGTKIAPFAPDYESARKRLGTRQPVALEYLTKRSAL